MSAPVALLFGVHAHQPAGNFQHVLEEAHARCYRPFMETCFRYPEFRFALHFSGPLLDYLFWQHTDDMTLLARMRFTTACTPRRTRAAGCVASLSTHRHSRGCTGNST